ncbi:MAG: hypothetical protein ABI609_00655 [Acidobacteriota bacterium]
MPTTATSTLDDEIRALYWGPLSEFTPARQALLKRLTKNGDPRAGEVKALRKPVPSAWGVNQLFAREPRAMAAFTAAIESATGKGGSVLRDALDAVRAEAGRLTSLALEILSATEGAPGPAVADRLRQNLDALAHDPAHRPLIEREWLDLDLDRPGFEVMAGLQLAAEQGPGSAATAPTSTKKANPTAQAAAKREAQERQERIERARQELAKIEQRARDLRRTADEAGESAQSATQAAAVAEQTAEQARRAATEAKRHAEGAAGELTRAREGLRGLERS